MSSERDITNGRFSGEFCDIIREQLTGTNINLTSFVFRHGANVYVFTYQKEGVNKHTFIDSGDGQYRNQMVSLLAGYGIDPAGIERIILTHRHPDHGGLADLLAAKSGAKITVHANFRSFIEGSTSPDERRWLDEFDPTRLRKYEIEYLPESDRCEMMNIHGLGFPRLMEPVTLGETGKILVLGCPESTSTHSPDQVIVLYSPRSQPYAYEKGYENFRPTDDILFSGDLWLMRGPMFSGGMGDLFRHPRSSFNQIRGLMSDGLRRAGPREQDAKAKEALKQGFCLIRVKPGHGEEFIGSCIIPAGLLADRDILVLLGYSLDADKSILKSKDLEPTIKALVERAYTSFVNEVLQWMGLGYSPSEVSELLVRIYKEQSGGGPLVEEDREERRERLKATLGRLKNDQAVSGELHLLADTTLAKLKRVA